MNSHELPGWTRTSTGAGRTGSKGPNATPHDGDLLIALESASSARYTIRQLPAVVRISSSSLDEAAQIACRFAQEHAVDVWYQDGDFLRLLAARRVESGPRPTRLSVEKAS